MTEVALRNVSMFFRSNPEWAIVESLRDIGMEIRIQLTVVIILLIGWRINKHYYLIGSKGDGFKSKRILTWVFVCLFLF